MPVGQRSTAIDSLKTVIAAIDPVPVSELVAGVFDALERDALQVYVPGYFADLASGKAADIEGFLSGMAAYVASQKADQ